MNPLLVLLALVLILAAVGKLRGRFGKDQAMSTALGQLVSTERVAVGIWRAIAIAEAAVGTALLTFPSSRVPAAGALVMFLGASGYVLLAHGTAPGRPCGCFGSTAETVTTTTLARALLLASTAATLAAVGRRWQDDVSFRWWLLATTADALVLAYLSPDLRAAVTQLVGRRVPACLTSHVPLETCRVMLARSSVWSRLGRLVDGAEFADHWRDGCWSFLAFRTTWNDEPATAVFAIRVPPGPQHVRATIVDDRTGRAVIEDHEVGRRSRLALRWRGRNRQVAA